MTPQQLKTNFRTKFDHWSPFFTDAQLNRLFQEAYTRVVERLYEQYQNNIKVSEQLGRLVTTAGGSLSLSGEYNPPSNFKYLLSLKVTYTTGESNKATIYREHEADDIYEAESKDYPKYRLMNGDIYPLPSSGVSSVTIFYLKEPETIDVTSSTPLLVPDKTCDMIIEEAVKEASKITREHSQYSVEDKDVKENQ